MFHEIIEGRLLPRIVAAGSSAARELVSGQLSVGVVLEGPTGERTPVTDDDLARWGVSVDELLPIALQNLRHRSSEADWEPVETVPGMRLYRPGGGDAAARLLLLVELVQPWPLAGVVFAVPSHDQLLCVMVHQITDVEALRVLVTATNYAVETLDAPLSDQLFWFDGQQVEWLRVSEDADGVEVFPTPGLIRALERLTSLELVSTAGEA